MAAPPSRTALLIGQYVLFSASLYVGYHTPPRLRLLLAFIQLLYTAWMSVWLPTSKDPADYSAVVTSSILVLRAVDMFALTDVYTSFRRKDKPSITYSQMSTGERIKFCLNNATSTRGVGWTWESPYLLPTPPPGRLQHLKRAATRFICFDLARCYVLLHPALGFFATGGATGTRTRDLPWHQKAAVSLSAAVISANSIGWFYELICAIWNTDCAPIMGRWRDCYTLRRFWGRVWHQINRRPLQVPSRWLAWNVFGFKRGSNGSSYTQLYCAFVLCGLGHVAGNAVITWQWYPVTMWFFTLQAVAITVEDFFIWVGGRFGLQTGDWVVNPEGKDKVEGWKGLGIRYVGYLWVTAWFCSVYWMMMDDYVLCGAASTQLTDMPSLFLPLLERAKEKLL